MREIELLLDRRWIIKQAHPEIYFKLRDQFSTYQTFFKEKLGYRLVVNPLLIKAEKVPGEAQAWMGIQAFEKPMEYVLFCLLLMFLEEKQPEEQFVLEQLTSFLENNFPPEGGLDWTVFSHRRSLIRVLRFSEAEGMILVNDGDEKTFEGAGTAAVLYENTGVSKYFARHFNFDLTQCNTHEDVSNSEWKGTDSDRGVIRRHRVYRRLVMNPVVYADNPEDQDYLYLKNQRSVIGNDIEKYLAGQLHLHRNGAMLVLGEQALLEDGFPNRKNISDIALHMAAVLKTYVNQSKEVFEADDSWVLSESKWDSLLASCVDNYGHGWSKAYREEISFSKLKEELLQFMEDFGMIKVLKASGEIRILPAAAKMTGHYPQDYVSKLSRKGEASEIMALAVTEKPADDTINIWEAADESLED